MMSESNQDKMLTAKEGIKSCASALGSQWIKQNPLFFMAIADTDLYETDFIITLKSLFKSTTTMNNLLSALIAFDNDAGTMPRFKSTFENNEEFRRKFYSFFIRLLMSAVHTGWTDTNAKWNHSYQSKTGVLSRCTALLFSTQDIGSLTQDDISATVDEVILNNISFKTFCKKLPGAESGFSARVTLPTKKTDIYATPSIYVNKVWP
jgi:hypothetical protein